MPHDRPRHALPYLRKLGALWPAVGVIGPRQSGKSTLLARQLEIPYQVTLDDEDVLDDALKSAKVFVARLPRPSVIDEAQKAPALFDALKASIDRKKQPGSYYLTGSSQFSARAGIRESLTGRIGLLQLGPLTLSELHSLPFYPPKNPAELQKTSRISVSMFSEALSRGGMPVPCFLRDPAARRLYWEGWLDTTIHRDLARLFKRSYDPRIALKILRKLAECGSQGEYFTADRVGDVQRRTLQNYLTALEEIFVLRRISCHELGVGKDHWMVFDSGLLSHLLGDALAEGNTLSLARTLVWQDLRANLEYAGRRMTLPLYYKSSRGSAIDLVWEGVPIKVITSSRLSALGWEERALHGAMKKLGSKRGILFAPVEHSDLPRSGVGVVPWGAWS